MPLLRDSGLPAVVLASEPGRQSFKAFSKEPNILGARHQINPCQREPIRTCRSRPDFDSEPGLPQFRAGRLRLLLGRNVQIVHDVGRLPEVCSRGTKLLQRQLIESVLVSAALLVLVPEKPLHNFLLINARVLALSPSRAGPRWRRRRPVPRPGSTNTGRRDSARSGPPARLQPAPMGAGCEAALKLSAPPSTRPPRRQESNRHRSTLTRTKSPRTETSSHSQCMRSRFPPRRNKPEG